MLFSIVHTTRYRYSDPASESFMEARLTPITNEKQRLIRRTLTIEPSCTPHSYIDYFGNEVDNFSIIRRHPSLTLTSRSIVETYPTEPPPEALDITISEARQIFHARDIALYEFVHASPAIDLNRETFRLANRFFKPTDHFGRSLHRLLRWIYRNFEYKAGVTTVDTAIDEVIRGKRGVCQDFAQLMISVLRSAQIPARYVCGYIETERERKASEKADHKTAKTSDKPLIGASESHAWVEVCLPNGYWYPLDPTNNCVAGERHVMLSTGRDHRDTSPTRGVFKGASKHTLKVAVVMHRRATLPK